ncbi:zwei Ig domain protein zig-8-like [Lucilia cuprina]|uniref:zwei Ig domain protein zig-8-like n=1 Tax=Lucilia cuprina TaxID=7375 RepID=UPI001F0666D4|nr:zwei Ig domain protein zig-8-like [Lucilia cuprina]
MYFGTENSTVVATQIGATAHIPCVVHHIGECVVSWIRKKDYHLLTVGLTTYSSDERFSATHLKHSEDWTLQIKFVQQRDAGIYECQVSTHPPTSIFLHLLVVEARAEISGPHIRYLTPGSTLRLQCHVVQNTEISEYIFWYHDNRMINYDADRGINVSTDPDFQSSELTISRTRREHSGNYTCVASNTQPASVLVHIFKEINFCCCCPVVFDPGIR